MIDHTTVKINDRVRLTTQVAGPDCREGRVAAVNLAQGGCLVEHDSGQMLAWTWNELVFEPLPTWKRLWRRMTRRHAPEE